MKVFVIAGEASGDKLGGELMLYLRELVEGHVQFLGVGGEHMAEQGLDSLFDMDELSVMGISEIMERYFALKKRVNQTIDAVCEADPDILITIDIPEFSLRVAKAVRAKAPQIRNVHYGAPSVWAWRPKRAVKMAAYIDQVLALLPFEPPYMQEAGLSCDFVGHPAVNDPVASVEEAAQFRRIYNIAEDAPLIALLPGSRSSEVNRLGGKFCEVAHLLRAQNPKMEFVVPTTFKMAGEIVRLFGQDEIGFKIVDPRDLGREQGLVHKRAAMRAADLAIAASGTVSLELAAANTPMVIAYDMNWLSRLIIPRLLKTDTVTLVNLVSETREVPEFLGAQATPENIAGAVAGVLNAPQSQYRAMYETMKRLGLGGAPPGLRAARAVLDGISKTASQRSQPVDP